MESYEGCMVVLGVLICVLAGAGMIFYIKGLSSIDGIKWIVAEGQLLKWARKYRRDIKYVSVEFFADYHPGSRDCQGAWGGWEELYAVFDFQIKEGRSVQYRVPLEKIESGDLGFYEYTTPLGECPDRLSPGVERLFDQLAIAVFGEEYKRAGRLSAGADSTDGNVSNIT